METYKITINSYIEAVGTREAINIFLEELEKAKWDILECRRIKNDRR